MRHALHYEEQGQSKKCQKKKKTDANAVPARRSSRTRTEHVSKTLSGEN
jgi:hypothetical protein